MSFYKINAKNLKGKEVNLSTYKNKVVLIVNTASNCTFTPQYEGLEKLHNSLNEQGLEILGFPCNQFGNQEPGSNTDIENGCLLNYGVSFNMFSKIDVNGRKEHELFTFLKEQGGSFIGKKIRWNFTKFLIDRNGNVVKRFAPWTKPVKIEKHIQLLLNS